jgi:hypothetical protein
VDYYSDNATVENYRQLPSKGYRLIIWRAHSALDLSSSYVAISTSDKDDPVKYDQYMREGKLTLCQITDDPDQYFAINPKFIREAMTGRFEDTVIILMSCNGLNDKYLGTAQALRDKGAKVLISWNEWIDSDNNDDAVTQLLGYLIDENNTINDAVHKIREYDSPGLPPSKLKYYPMTAETAGYRIPDYRQETSAKTHLQQQLLTRRSREQPDNVGAFLRLSRCALGTQTLKSSRNNHAQLATQRVA